MGYHIYHFGIHFTTSFIEIIRNGLYIELQWGSININARSPCKMKLMLRTQQREPEGHVGRLCEGRRAFPDI